MKRKDFKIISDWIRKDSTILDLGCGDSTLLEYLLLNKNSSGYGFEKNIEKVQESIKKNINVIQADFNNDLHTYFEKNFFDYAIMTQALQENEDPNSIILEMVRVAKEGIVTFPNMGFWKNRFQLGFLGRMPISESLPNRCLSKSFRSLPDQLACLGSSWKDLFHDCFHCTWSFLLLILS